MDNLKRFECKICKKRFRQLEPLESHMRAEKHNYASGDHSPSTSDRPPIPKLILNLKELRKVTSQKKSQNQEKIITCLFCDKVFSGFNKLVDHAPHDKSEIFRAKDGSNSTWPNADTLYRHKHRVHSKPRYKCSACCQIFKGYEAFRKHRSEVHKSKMVEGRHTIKGLLVCTQEERQRRTSTFHKKFADDEQRFECNYCRYKCHEYSRLENHMKGHTREGPFVCSECAAGSQPELTTEREQQSTIKHAEVASVGNYKDGGNNAESEEDSSDAEEDPPRVPEYWGPDGLGRQSGF